MVGLITDQDEIQMEHKIRYENHIYSEELSGTENWTIGMADRPMSGVNVL